MIAHPSGLRSIPAHAGSPSKSAHGVLDARSIPAHAGEPPVGDGAAIPIGVYPRPRGGAWKRSGENRLHWGLSPPTRGSRRSVRDLAFCDGSIPAHAGEPR